MKETNFLQGSMILINKPLRWTSFDVVKKIRNSLKFHYGVKKIKVGHAGTLDPLADGLLILCTGKWTKKIEEFQNLEKEYTGTFVLGATTPSYDLETEIDQTFAVEHLNTEQIINHSKKFIGKIKQKPPIFSAIKKDGVRLYEHARNGKDVEIKEREIFIKEFEITNINFPHVDFRVVCSKGTYIRSLAHDFGKSLDNGAYLSKLTRTKIGSYRVEKAKEIDEIVSYLESEKK